ncbi:hypothetical protein DICVIV_14405 [Dictyocaulus viviparus]|uniref:Uncharacterized protein n=1 Tax=Dictyocaulus viviparus TaxID=29172 RepID=A0A0D8X5B1_DICVI|nr:hypothetical protein DICVIV_14405 [Dictyocaulus viviparus]
MGLPLRGRLARKHGTVVPMISYGRVVPSAVRFLIPSIRRSAMVNKVYIL